ncbi:MAG: nucleoside phosphorylase [Thermoplasmata archaeon]
MAKAQHEKKTLSPADLTLSAKGKVYHLDISPEELAKDILIVGDPDRVTVIAEEFFVKKEVEVFHRGLRTITGWTKDGLRVTATTSGMGTPSLEIVLNEIVLLNEVNLATRTRKDTFEQINIIRVGTSGGLQRETKLGTPVITAYAVGLDNTGLFYDAGYQSEKCRVIEEKVTEALRKACVSERFGQKIFPYVSQADATILKAMKESAEELNIETVSGITVSNAGFFANQGRDVSRIPLSIPDIDGVLAAIGEVVDGMRIENMEMESSFLLHFMGALGYRAGAICPAIANRREETFTPTYLKNVRDSTEIALRTLKKLRAVS